MIDPSARLRAWNSRRRALRIFGVVIALIGLVGGVALIHDLATYASGFDEDDLERATNLDDDYGFTYGGYEGDGNPHVTDAPPNKQVAKDVPILLDVAEDTMAMSPFLPQFRPSVYERIEDERTKLRKRSKKRRIRRDDAEGIEAITKLSQHVSYAHYSAEGTLLAHLIMMGALLIGGILGIVRWGRAGALLVVVAGLAPTIWYDPGTKIVAYIGFMLIGVALFFVAPGRKPDGPPGALTHWLESPATPRQAGLRLALLGVFIVLFSAGISAASIAVAGELGATSAPVAVGGIAYGLVMIFTGLTKGAAG